MVVDDLVAFSMVCFLGTPGDLVTVSQIDV